MCLLTEGGNQDELEGTAEMPAQVETTAHAAAPPRISVPSVTVHYTQTALRQRANEDDNDNDNDIKTSIAACCFHVESAAVYLTH